MQNDGNLFSSVPLAAAQDRQAMSSSDMEPATVVTSIEHLREIAQELEGCPQLAVDIESNGFYVYRERVCLIQISSSHGDVIVDPLAIRDLSPLGDLFSNPRMEKIFHAGEYDILCLKRDYGFTFSHVFDTMIAARLLGIKELGLAAAIDRHFGVKLSKKWQRADWGRRPLSLDQLRYARLDVHYLIRLAEIQKSLLGAKGRLEDAEEAFKALERLKPVERLFDPEAYRRLAAARGLSGKQLGVLRELYLFRERKAAELDRAPFRIMPEELLARLALSAPDNPEALRRAKGVTPYLFRKFSQDLIDAIRRGFEAPTLAEIQPAARPKRDHRWIKLFETLRQWRKGKAQEEGVDPVVVLSTNELRDIARRATARETEILAGLSPLKQRRYAAELLKLLEGQGTD